MVTDQVGQGPDTRSLRACGLARTLRLAGPWLTMAAAALAPACWDSTHPDHTTLPQQPALGIVSNPAMGAGAASHAAASPSAMPTSVVYVSLPPDSLPQGELAFIRNGRTGDSVAAAMANGGFDPVPLVAVIGDTLALDIQLGTGGYVHGVLVVPAFRKPRVIRTRPTQGKRDVVLNAAPRVVFSEPMKAVTVGSENVRLLRNGVPVSGQVTLSADGLRAEFQPDGLLEPNTDYVLSVTNGVGDLTGDPLEEPLSATFTTGGTVAVASVETAEPALLVNPFSNQLRSFEFYAVLHDDGRVTGSWHIFYPERGWAYDGPVTCFAIADGKAAWVAGFVDSAKPNQSVLWIDTGWRAVDRGTPEGGIPDQLTLANPLLYDSVPGMGSAEDFCAVKPTKGLEDPDLDPIDLLRGDIVVMGETPPPPPAPVPSGQIAFLRSDTVPSEGGIFVVNADGTGARRLTDMQAFGGHPAWSPDGMKLAFTRVTGDPEWTLLEYLDPDVYVMNVDGSGVTRLTFDGHSGDPAWSPDGKRMAFTRGDEIYVMNVDGSGVTRLTNNPLGWDNQPSWSPDGTKIAFASQRDGLDYEIYVMNADGSGVTRLTSGPGQKGAPAWSPDGTRIAFMAANDPLRLFVMYADGSGLRQLLSDERLDRPSWSPDGRMIAFGLGGDLYAMAASGGRVTRITGDAAYDVQPAWCCLRKP